MNSVGMRIATHLLAAGLAWLVAGRLLEKPAPVSTDQSSGRSSTKSGPRAATASKASAEVGVLAPWLAPGPDPAITARLKDESLTTLADSLFAPVRDTDIGELVRLVSDRQQQENRVNPVIRAFRSLVLTDPEGVREWVGSLGADDQTKFNLLLGFRMMPDAARISSAIPDEQLESWRDIAGDNRWLEMEQGRRAGQAGDTAWLDQQLRKLADASGSRSEVANGLTEAIANWPADSASDLVGKINPHLDSIRSGLSRLIARLPQEKRLAFIDSMIPPVNGKAVSNSIRQNAALSAVGADPAERLEILSPVYGGDAERTTQLLVRNDVDRLLSNTELPADDPLNGVLQRVRAGEMKADELLREITARLGPLAAGNEQLIRDRVVGTLLKTAPAAAVELMADTPIKAVQDKVFALRFDPADFEAASVVLRAREPELPAQMQARFSFWGHKSVEGLSRYGDAYVSWALAMPRSLERDLVLSAIAVHVEKDQPEWAARLRSEKSFQSGWRPGMK